MKLVSEHTFYCDICKNKIGKEIADTEDGQYTELGYAYIEIGCNGRKYKADLHICDDCVKEFEEKIKSLHFQECN